MGAAAAPLVAESVMAESFAVAAPTMFTAAELAPLAAPTFGGLSAAGAEFGTAALLGEAGTNASILSALGSGAGASAAPTLAQGIASGAAQGLGGAGATGINEALVSANEANAVNSGIQEVAKDVVPKYMEDTVPKLLQDSVASYGSDEATREAMARAAETAKDIVPEATKDLLPEIKAGSAIDKPYISQFAQNAVPGGAGLPGAMTAGAGETPLANGFQQALDFAKANPFSAASMAYSANNLLNKKTPEEQKAEEYNGPLKNYKMSPNFKGRHANPEDYQYTPKVYAEGGIASFKSGGDAGSKLAMDYYESMQRQQSNAPAPARGPLAGGIGHDPGIYYDLDPDTRYLDPVSAAQVRMAKINKRSNVQAQNMKRPMGLGQINLSPPGAKAQEGDTTTDAAHGGIMRARKYADGGITGGGNLDLHIPLDLGGGGGGYGGGGGNGGATYPFQNNGGFVGNNNAPQVQPQQAQPQQPQQAQSPLPAFAQDPVFQSMNRQNDLFGQQMNDYMQTAPKGLSDQQMGDYSKTAPMYQDMQNLQSKMRGLAGGMAGGGITSLGGYAAGGNPRLLRGPGDGMSDNIPATIAGKQPARLADGEFVIPADVVSHLGNGSTEAGAKILHAMMTKVRKERTGNPKQGKQINAHKFVPT